MKQSYSAPTIRLDEMYGLNVLAESSQAESMIGAESSLGETWFGDIYG